MAKGHQLGTPKTPGSGRQRGTPNKVTGEFRKAAAKAGRSPLEHMTWVMNDKKNPLPMRNAMAEAAAPYLHPKVTPSGATTINNNVLDARRDGIQVTYVQPAPRDDDPRIIDNSPPAIPYRPAAASEIVRPHEQPLRNAALVEPTPDPVAKATSNGADPANPMYLDKPPNRPSIFKPAGKGRNGWMGS